MLDCWIADVVGRMRISGISNRALAQECGVSYTYISEVLHGRKGNGKTQKRIMDALDRLEKKQISANLPSGKKGVN